MSKGPLPQFYQLIVGLNLEFYKCTMHYYNNCLKMKYLENLTRSRSLVEKPLQGKRERPQLEVTLEVLLLLQNLVLVHRLLIIRKACLSRVVAPKVDRRCVQEMTLPTKGNGKEMTTSSRCVNSY